MKIMSSSENMITNAKEQLMYIYQSYINTRPAQSNLFPNILRSYRADLLENSGNLELQTAAIKESLRTILDRYKYKKNDVTITYNSTELKFEIDIDAVTSDGVAVKLSETVIFE